MKRDEILEKLKKAEILSGSKVSAGSSKHLLEKIEKELRDICQDVLVSRL